MLRAEEVTITNVFDSEDIINVLRDISAQTGINILAEPSVQGWITLGSWTCLWNGTGHDRGAAGLRGSGELLHSRFGRH